MRTIATQLETFIDQHLENLRSVSPDEMKSKPSPARWSKKEIIGHLADSAQSNIRRFVVAQYEDSPYIVYDQDKWVTIANYQQWDCDAIIDLWYALNKQICRILENTSPEMGKRECRTQEIHTLEWLAADYVKHLRHHVHQVLELDPVPYP
jgi:hypothetical protein